MCKCLDQELHPFRILHPPRIQLTRAEKSTKEPFADSAGYFFDSLKGILQKD